MKKAMVYIMATLMTVLWTSIATAQGHGKMKEEVGEVHFTISSDRPETQEQFNRAVALLYSFAYGNALKAFYDITLLEPKCAMAYWGIAMSHFHPVWEEVPNPAQVKASLEAIKNAKHVGIKSEREKDYIAAIEIIYTDVEKTEYRSRVLNFEQAMENMYLKYPDDREVAVIYGLTLDATALKSDKTYAKQKKAGEILLKVFEEQPNHPGVVHYIIHAYDYPPLAKLGLNAARKYARIAPSVAHALHMPSHIFVRLGLWEDNIQTNIASADAGLANARKDNPEASSFDALHAWDYIMYGYLQQAQDKEAQALVEKLRSVRQLDRANFAAAYALAAIPARFSIERKDWKSATSLMTSHSDFPWEKFPWTKSLTHFARAMGFARIGDIANARLSIDELQGLQKASAAANEPYWANQVEILKKSAEAWTLLAEGKTDEALRMMHAAADQEDASDKHPVTPGSIVPQRELLAEMLLELNDPKQALSEFEAALIPTPNRFNGIAGAARAAALSGDKVKARKYYASLVALTKKSDTERAQLEEAKKYLATTE
ncbi:MAG: hypothetical protein HY562_01820 [Ignavibacteriales bacterium]|nr:hypothetical protein [Ignavibacteriales bacterium]